MGWLEEIQKKLQAPQQNRPLFGISASPIKNLANVAGSVVNLFSPQTVQKVREVKQTVDKIPQTIVNTVRQAPPRAVASVGIQAASDVLNKVGVKAEPVWQPKTPIQKFLLGEEPIVGVRKRFETNQPIYTQKFQNWGVNPETAKRWGTGAALLGVIGGTALDITPFGGGEKAVAAGGMKAAEEVGVSLLRRYGDDAVRGIKAMASGDAKLIDRVPATLKGDILSVLRRGSTVQDLEKAISGKVLSTTTQKGKEVSRLVSSIEKSPSFSKDVIGKISGETQRYSNKQTLNEALSQLPKDIFGKVDLDKAKSTLQTIANDPTKTFTRIQGAQAKWVAEKLMAKGATDEALQFFEDAAKAATKSGQASQVWALWGKLTPEGAILEANRLRNQATTIAKTADKLGSRWGKMGRNVIEKAGIQLNKILPEISPAQTDAIRAQAKKALEIAGKFGENSREHILEVAKLQKLVTAHIPVPLLQKIESVQTMAQLLNPTTFIRNLVGNVGFSGLENVSDVTATGLDKLASVITRQRSKVLPSIGTQVKGFGTGLKEGIQEVKVGVNTMGNLTQYDLPTRNLWEKFNPKTGEFSATPILGQLEKVLNYELRAFDRASFVSTYEEEVRNMLSAIKKNGIKMTDDVADSVKEFSKMKGLYRTFQDDTFLGNTVLSGMKKVLNLGQAHGLGSYIIKYPKTPGAIVTRGLEYSPIGLAKSAFQLFFDMPNKYVRQAMKNNKLPDELINIMKQRTNIEATARGLVGSSLVGAGAALAALGIIKGKGSKDADVNSLDKSGGFDKYKLNVDALYRFITSGLNPDVAKPQEGDLTISYDWFQPTSIPLIIGANINDNEGKNEGLVGKIMSVIKDSIPSTAETATGMPVLQGIQNILNAYTYSPKDTSPINNVVYAIFKSVPASWVPSFLAKIAYVIDPTSRNANIEGQIQPMVAQVMKKIPWLSKELAPQISSLGQPVKYGQASLLSKTQPASTTERALNTFFSPAFLDRVKLTPEAQMVKDVATGIGSEGVYPRLIDQKQSVAGFKFTLTPEQQSQMQTELGQKTQEIFRKLATNSLFQLQTNEVKGKELSNDLEKLSNGYKAKFFLQSLGVSVPDGANLENAYNGLSRLNSNKEFAKLSEEEQLAIIKNLFSK